jgi:type II restriction enzyme
MGCYPTKHTKLYLTDTRVQSEELKNKKTAQQCDPPNGYPRHAPCWFRFAPLARVAPRAAIGDRGRWAENTRESTSNGQRSTCMTKNERIQRLIAAIPELSSYRLQLVDKVVGVFQTPKAFVRNQSSSLITSQVLEDFGDVLRLHHAFSREPFSKDKFEYALERVLIESKVSAKLAPRGSRGYDIEIGQKRFSLKTEAAKRIQENTIHISKFMELGGGQWGSDPSDLIGLRQQFLSNLEGIQKILILRALRKGEPSYRYELVEIPKRLLLKAANGRLEMKTDSSQNPKPGYCYVEEGRESLFSLYFDGGGERKLQIKGLRKSLCVVHGTWDFSVIADNP